MSTAQTLMFIRHGEKPGEHGGPHGVNHHGEADPHSLSVRGWTRAGALAALFGHASSASDGIVTPQRVVATKASEKAKSRREVDTATPTAKRLALDLDERYGHGDEAALATDLMDAGHDALIVWHHGNLPELLSHLPIANRADVPSAWPEDRFDLIWVLTRSGDAYAFAQVDQDLLDGDQVRGSG